MILGLTIFGGIAVPPLFTVGAHAIADGPVNRVSERDLLDLNTATPAQLAQLPGMGPAYAKRVIEGRPYSAKNQLVNRGVLPASAYEQLKDRVVAHRPPKW